MKAHISEIFSSIQGEGLFVGVRQIFVRFFGCNILSCPYCDTAPRRAIVHTLDDVMDRIRRLEKISGPHHSVCLTGGEPLAQVDFLEHLLPHLKKRHFKVYLETNGTLPQALRRVVNHVDIISMDIKPPSAANAMAYWDEHREFLKAGRRKNIFVKLVLTGGISHIDFWKAVDIIENIDREIPLILQPVTPTKKFKDTIPTDKLLKLQTAARRSLSNVSVIPQVHKILGVR